MLLAVGHILIYFVSFKVSQAGGPHGSTLNIQLTRRTIPSSSLNLILVSVTLGFTQTISQDTLKLPRAGGVPLSAAPGEAGAELPAGYVHLTSGPEMSRELKRWELRVGV